MKKNILILLIFILVILCTGCGNKSIEINDKSLGYSSLLQGNGFKLKDVMEGDNDSSDSVTFINKKLNISVIAYYVKMDKENYEFSKKMKKQNSQFTKFSEFKFNGYDSYGYLSNDNLAQLYILIDENNDYVITLYMYIEKYRERDNTDLYKVLNSDQMNEFISSIQVSNI